MADPVATMRPLVTTATQDVISNAAKYTSNMQQLLQTANSVAAAMVAAGEVQGVPVLAVVPVLEAVVAAYTPLATAAAGVAESAFA